LTLTQQGGEESTAFSPFRPGGKKNQKKQQVVQDKAGKKKRVLQGPSRRLLADVLGRGGGEKRGTKRRPLMLHQGCAEHSYLATIATDCVGGRETTQAPTRTCWLLLRRKKKEKKCMEGSELWHCLYYSEEKREIRDPGVLRLVGARQKERKGKKVVDDHSQGSPRRWGGKGKKDSKVRIRSTIRELRRFLQRKKKKGRFPAVSRSRPRSNSD